MKFKSTQSLRPRRKDERIVLPSANTNATRKMPLTGTTGSTMKSGVRHMPIQQAGIWKRAADRSALISNLCPTGQTAKCGLGGRMPLTPADAAEAAVIRSLGGSPGTKKRLTARDFAAGPPAAIAAAIAGNLIAGLREYRGVLSPEWAGAPAA